MSDKLKFDGGTHKTDDFSPDERAKIRQRNEHYDVNFLQVDDFLKETGLKWLSDTGKALPSFIKAFLTVGAIVGAYAGLKSAGVL